MKTFSRRLFSVDPKYGFLLRRNRLKLLFDHYEALKLQSRTSIQKAKGSKKLFNVLY